MDLGRERSKSSQEMVGRNIERPPNPLRSELESGVSAQSLGGQSSENHTAEAVLRYRGGQRWAIVL